MSDEEQEQDPNQTRWNEATRCPKCDKPGREVAAKPGNRRGVMVHVIECQTELCRWFHERWFVQVNEDGSIPAPYSQVGEKKYPRVSEESLSRLNDAINNQLKAEVRGDGEIRNPFSR